MQYKLFTNYITLQSLLKTTGILHSGGAVKIFLAENTVLLNGQKEDRRGKKIYAGDCIDLPNQNLSITVIEPSEQERAQHLKEMEEKERVAKIVKEMNKDNKKKTVKQTTIRKKGNSSDHRPIRFPGT